MHKKKHYSSKMSIFKATPQSPNPKVSILVPFLGNEVYFYQCIEKILQQTLTEIQILCLIQDFTNETKRIISAFFSDNQKIKIISISEQKKLKEYIDGEYVFILNPSDYLEPTALERIYKKAKAIDAEIIFGNPINYGNQETHDKITKISFQKEKIPQNHIFSPYDFYEILFDMVPIVSGCYMYEKNFFLKFCSENDCKYFLSYSFIIESLTQASKIAYLDFDILHYTDTLKNLGTIDLVQEFKNIQVFLEKDSLNQFKSSFIRLFLKLLWEGHNTLREPQRSLFDLKIVKEIFPSISENLKNFISHPIFSLSSKFSLLTNFEKALSNSLLIIPIVIPIYDDTDAYKAMVTIQSIINHAKFQNWYDVYILHTANLKEDTKQRLETLSQGSVRVTCLDIGKKLPKLPLSNEKQILDCCLFFLDDIFSDYSKILYFKNQIIVQKDPSVFFHIDMGNNSLAGTTSYGDIDYIEKDLGLVYEKFINIDVLLFNLNIWRQEKLSQRFLNLISTPVRNYRNLRQDILNYICADTIYLLANYYNGKRSIILQDEIVENYPIDPDSFYIINYDDKMPWDGLELELMERWWKIARKNPFYETILAKTILNKINISTSKLKIINSQRITPKSVNKKTIMLHRNDENMYLLIKNYVKESLGYFFTFGQTKKKHKDALLKIYQEFAKNIK